MTTSPRLLLPNSAEFGPNGDLKPDFRICQNSGPQGLNPDTGSHDELKFQMLKNTEGTEKEGRVGGGTELFEKQLNFGNETAKAKPNTHPTGTEVENRGFEFVS